MSEIFVVGIGPGDRIYRTVQAEQALEKSSVLVGYGPYLELLRADFPEKEYFASGMRQEKERCKKCIDFAAEGKTVALVCSGDAGVYGMASLLLETAGELLPEGDCADIHRPEITVIPGVTAALSGAAVLGAPLGHDFCVISLSDLLTPWDVIEKRLRCAVEGDFCIALYNTGSHHRKEHLKRACAILSESLPQDRLCGVVRKIGREGTEETLCTLQELSVFPVDMLATVFIGNSMTREIHGRMVTPRGYDAGIESA
ncbi:MAG: precorrin-3B C(17)-methyltransferase [Lachnospiraceae bacterium]|nr:precorrin-3B C(17)-methyltransferase [Lachnospiraceae bacterium]